MSLFCTRHHGLKGHVVQAVLKVCTEYRGREKGDVPFPDRNGEKGHVIQASRRTSPGWGEAEAVSTHSHAQSRDRELTQERSGPSWRYICRARADGRGVEEARETLGSHPDLRTQRRMLGSGIVF